MDGAFDKTGICYFHLVIAGSRKTPGRDKELFKKLL
jgi:hypothetical protein